MNCRQARDVLLEADLAELRGEGDTPVARHLRTCEACRRAARHIIDAESALAAGLAAERPRRPAPEAVEAVLSSAAAATARRSARRWRLLVPALAAAGVAAVLLARAGNMPQPTTSGVRAAEPERPLVEASSGQHVAVIETDNPNIVVVWTF